MFRSLILHLKENLSNLLLENFTHAYNVLWSNLTPILSLTIPPISSLLHFFSLPTSSVLSFSFQIPTLLLLCGGGDHTGAWVSSQGLYSWRKLIIPPPEAISCHTTPQMGWDFMKFPLSLMLVCWLPWSCADLHTWSQVLWAHTRSCAIMSAKRLTIRHVLPLALNISTHFPIKRLEPQGERRDVVDPSRAEDSQGGA